MKPTTWMSTLVFCLCLFSLSPSFVYAEPMYPKETVIVYGNGVFSDESSAVASVRELEERVLFELGGSDVGSQISFDIAYNRTHKVSHGLLDLAEAFVQYFGSFASHFWHWLAGIDSLPDFTQDALSLIAGLVDQASLVTNSNVQEHVEMYNQLLLECKRVVVVAHSQGNFYANIAHGGIEPEFAGSFRIVSVANPASLVKGDGPHTTIGEDVVIALIPGSMPANVDNYDQDESYSPWHGHAFVENYLSSYSHSEFKIVTDVINSITEGMAIDNYNNCGWPAIFGTNFRLIRQPYDFVQTSNGPSSDIWTNIVWPAALNDSLLVEYRLGTSGPWKNLSRNPSFSNSIWYESDPIQPGFIAPWLVVRKQHPIYENIYFSIEVQPDDALLEIPKGVQQYRLIVDGKVIEQFTADYHMVPWSTVRTSGPILDPLPAGSNPIELIQ